jgi:pimeloyl-ACP methyl ester carboxylesterase
MIPLLNMRKIFHSMRWILVASIIQAAAAIPQSPQLPNDSYTKPQLQVALPDGRHINLVCSGAGSPTVILTAGLNDWSIAWQRVQPEVARITRVCSWDRAGFGFSDPRRDALDIARSARDLEAALKGAKINGPIIVVGHSMGGLETLIFADDHKAVLRGILLVDPTIPGQYQNFEQIAPHFTRFARSGRATGTAAALACAKALRNRLPEPERPGGCPPPIPPIYPQDVISALTPYQASPDHILTQSSLVTTMERSTKLGMNARRNYGDIPLVILSAPADDTTVPAGIPTAFSFPPDIDPVVLEEVPRMAAAIAAGHAALAKLSTRGSVRQFLGVGHYIPLIRPDLVIDAINELVEKARMP